MLALASALAAFATIVCLYFRAPNRGEVGKLLQFIGGRAALSWAAIGGLAGSLALAVLAQGWAAGIGLWIIALMVTGVAVVSLAGSYPALTQLLGCASAATAPLVVIAYWMSL